MIHLIPLLEGGLIFFILEFFLFKPVLAHYILLIATLCIILGMLVPKQRFLSGKEFWHYILNPLFFLWSAILLLLFFESAPLKHFFILVVSVYIFLYFENLFYFLVAAKKESEESFLRMTSLMNIVSMFFLATGLYGLKIFLQIPLPVLIILLFISSLALIYGPAWLLKRNLKEIFLEMLVISLIAVELFIVLNFLPLAFYVSGAIFGIIYYCLAGILINYLKSGIIVYKRYAATSLILLVLIMGTARWV